MASCTMQYSTITFCVCSDEGIDDATIEMLIIQMDINGDG